MMNNDSQYLGMANAGSDYDLRVSDMVCKWLQEKYDLKPSESMDIWSQAYTSIENMVQMIHRNNFLKDMLEISK